MDLKVTKKLCFSHWRRVSDDIRDSFSSYVLAVSGGADSMCMLDFVRRIKGIEFVVAHFNHGDRYENDDRDQEFVEEYCLKYHIPIFVQHGDTDRIIKARSLELESRNQRYTFLSSVKRLMGYDRIMCAHNASDQVETILMRLLKGKPFDDIVMLKDNGFVFRPFLQITSDQIRETCRFRNIPYRDDETNNDRRRLRNWIRHEVIPVINTRCNSNNIATSAMKFVEEKEKCHKSISEYFKEFK